ncbi:MFP1 attachment factor [Musa troglodytarum]|uniref:MFP1 attachment factor n=1 Tax=Musa troglodytarum TaxID=320322 RepID=A0A9E7JC68_9LILI|nr:MFP1 attachment factor [Musa troglodytarum]
MASAGEVANFIKAGDEFDPASAASAGLLDVASDGEVANSIKAGDELDPASAASSGLLDVASDGEVANSIKAGDELDPASAASAGLLDVFLNIWPPSQVSRDAVIQRLADTLSSPSALSKCYGVVSVEDASSIAAVIEQEAFAVANCHGVCSFSDGDYGLEILQIYTREIGKRTTEFIESSAPPASSAPIVEVAADDFASIVDSASTTDGDREVYSSTESESA